MIAIISILASMLLPALAKARESAWRVSCMDHNKRLYKSGYTGSYYPASDIIALADYTFPNRRHRRFREVTSPSKTLAFGTEP